MDGFCYKTANIWSILGYVILILKILVPIIIILLGIVEFGKATVSSDDKAIKKTLATMIKKIVVGIAIFFVPTIINLIFSLIGNFEPFHGDYLNCVDCLTSPYEKCDTSYEGEIFH
ncbi:MAG: hypothetical protein K2M17_04010 [Bacilli bacterium]|nr:hypothetical protein [Bacilli bacterium]